MPIADALHPAADQLAALQQPGSSGPVVMVKLLRYRDRAQYGDGRSESISGREAYQRYGMAVTAMVHALGGRIVYAGPVLLETLPRCGAAVSGR